MIPKYENAISMHYSSNPQQGGGAISLFRQNTNKTQYFRKRKSNSSKLQVDSNHVYDFILLSSNSNNSINNFRHSDVVQCDIIESLTWFFVQGIQRCQGEIPMTSRVL